MSLKDLQIHIAPKTLFEIAPGVPVTNTILTMWVVMGILIGLALFVRLTLKYLPNGFQNFVEWSLGGLHDFMENIGGKEVQRHFKFFITFFLFILCSNWLGLSLGIVAEQSGIIRAPTSDLNSTIALSLVAFLYFEYQGIKTHGLWGYINHFFNFKALFTKGWIGIIDFLAGLLHIISELVRPIALSLRLFGNIFGGEIVLVIAFLLVAPIIPIPFMMLEFIVGLVQAFVFAILFLTFTSMNSAPPEEQHS